MSDAPENIHVFYDCDGEKSAYDEPLRNIHGELRTHEYRRADLVDLALAERDAEIESRIEDVRRLNDEADKLYDKMAEAKRQLAERDAEIALHKQHNTERIKVHAEVVDRMALEIETLRERVEKLQNELQLVIPSRDFVKAARAWALERAGLPGYWIHKARDAMQDFDDGDGPIMVDRLGELLREAISAVEQGDSQQ